MTNRTRCLGGSKIGSKKARQGFSAPQQFMPKGITQGQSGSRVKMFFEEAA